MKRPLHRANAAATAPARNSIGANIFLWLTPICSARCRLSAESIERAIELNGEAVAMNLPAFRFRRRRAARCCLGSKR
jgi:indolepyruvate ferredoxin oxidoreductase